MDFERQTSFVCKTEGQDNSNIAKMTDNAVLTAKIIIVGLVDASFINECLAVLIFRFCRWKFD